MPDLNAMTPTTASAIIGVLVVLVFALSVEFGRWARASDDKLNRIIWIAACAYFGLFFVELFLLLAVTNDATTDGSAAWIGFFILFVIDAASLLAISTTALESERDTSSVVKADPSPAHTKRRKSHP